MKRGASTKWLKGLLNKACMSDEYSRGGNFTYYGHKIDVVVGKWDIINILIEHFMEISIDEGVGKITCSNVPKPYIKPIMEYVNQLYWGFIPYATNKFKKLVLPYSNTSEEWKNGNRGYVTIDWFDEEDREEKMKNYNEKFIKQ